MQKSKYFKSACREAGIIILVSAFFWTPAMADSADILGMTLGQPIGNIKSLVDKRLIVQPSSLTYRFANGIIVDLHGFDARNNKDAPTEAIGVLPTSISNKVWFIGRLTFFSGGSRPSMDALKAQLISKYGRPSLVMGEGSATIAENLVWFTTQTGNRIPAGSSAAESYRINCTLADTHVVDVGNPAADIDAPSSFNGECPVVVAAKFFASRDNPGLASQLNVSLFDPSMEISEMKSADEALKKKNNDAAQKAAGVKPAL